MNTTTGSLKRTYSWGMTFPERPEGNGSYTLITRLAMIGVSHFLFQRGILEESYFKARRIGSVKFWVFAREGKGSKCYNLLTSIFDAIRIKCLKQLVITISSGNNPNEVFETFTFTFRYGQETEQLIADGNGQELSGVRYEGPEKVREQTLKLVKSITTYCQATDPPEGSAVPNFFLVYYENVLPRDYLPSGFEVALVDNCRFVSSTQEVLLGAVDGQLHGCDVSVETTLIKNSVDKDIVMDAISSDRSSSILYRSMSDFANVSVSSRSSHTDEHE